MARKIGCRICNVSPSKRKYRSHIQNCRTDVFSIECRIQHSPANSFSVFDASAFNFDRAEWLITEQDSLQIALHVRNWEVRLANARVIVTKLNDVLVASDEFRMENERLVALNKKMKDSGEDIELSTGRYIF